MTNPVLKKLSKPCQPASALADLLQKHIGDGSNEHHCKEAFEALVRIKNRKLAIPAQVLGRLISNGSNYCELVRLAADLIRFADADGASETVA